MLDSNAKISDIIALLQESEGINQKAELKSILIDKGIAVEDTEDMAGIVSKVNNLVKLDPTCVPKNIKENVNINGVIGILKSQTDLVSKLSNNMRASSNYLISSIFSDDIWIMQLANGTITAIQLDEEYNQIKTINLDTGIEYITDISYVYKRGNYIFTRPGAYGSSFMYDLNGNLIKTFATQYLVIIYCDEARNRLIVIDDDGLELRDSSNNILVNFNVSLDSKYILVIPYGNLLFVFTDGSHLVIYPDNTYKIIFNGMFFNE